MKVIIAGSRILHLSTEELQQIVTASGFDVTVLCSGAARGVDQSAELWATERNIPVERFVPDWRRFGRAAGLMRNRQMAQCAIALIAIWDGESRGTAHMIKVARQLKLKVYVHQAR